MSNSERGLFYFSPIWKWWLGGLFATAAADYLKSNYGNGGGGGASEGVDQGCGSDDQTDYEWYMASPNESQRKLRYAVLDSEPFRRFRAQYPRASRWFIIHECIGLDPDDFTRKDFERLLRYPCPPG